MFESLKALYLQGRLTEKGLANAVAKGWICEDQMQEIIEASE